MNSRPPVPKTGALPLRYFPVVLASRVELDPRSYLELFTVYKTVCAAAHLARIKKEPRRLVLSGLLGVWL